MTQVHWNTEGKLSLGDTPQAGLDHLFQASGHPFLFIGHFSFNRRNQIHETAWEASCMD